MKLCNQAAEETLPRMEAVPKRPWIQPATLELILERNKARLHRNPALERDMNRKIRRQAKKDRAKWLNDMTADGSWDQVRKLRKPVSIQERKLKD